MISLDTPTLFAALTVAQFAGAAMLAVFWGILTLRHDSGGKSLLFWAAAMVLGAFGTLMIANRGLTSDFLSIVAANALIIVSVGLRGSGLAGFLKELRHLWSLGAAAFVWLVLCTWPAFLDSYVARVNLVQVCMILFCGWMMHLAFFRNRDRLYSVTLVGVTAVVECAANIWFAVHQNMGGYGSMEEAGLDGATTIYLIVLIFSIVMSVVAPVGMVIENLLLRYREQAFKDPLTGLPNRRAFWNACQARTGGSGPSKSYGLLMFNIDGLKRVNSEFGTAMGDVVVQLFASLARDACREGAVAGRVSLEEFTVFMPGLTPEQTLIAAQGISRRFGIECQEASSGKLIVSTCAGVIHVAAHVPFERALESSRRALRKAKRIGHGQIYVADHGQKPARVRLNGGVGLRARKSAA